MISRSRSRGTPPPFGGPLNLIKREKTLRVCARMQRVLVVNSSEIRNPVSAPDKHLKVNEIPICTYFFALGTKLPFENVVFNHFCYYPCI